MNIPMYPVLLSNLVILVSAKLDQYHPIEIKLLVKTIKLVKQIKVILKEIAIKRDLRLEKMKSTNLDQKKLVVLVKNKEEAGKTEIRVQMLTLQVKIF